jgi:hypothetical protein
MGTCRRLMLVIVVLIVLAITGVSSTVIPKDGPYDYGHKPGHEWWRTQQRAREKGWTREEVFEFENNPKHYQIEDPSSNRSHKYEMPR